MSNKALAAWTVSIDLGVWLKVLPRYVSILPLGDIWVNASKACSAKESVEVFLKSFRYSTVDI